MRELKKALARTDFYASMPAIEQLEDHLKETSNGSEFVLPAKHDSFEAQHEGAERQSIHDEPLVAGAVLSLKPKNLAGVSVRHGRVFSSRESPRLWSTTQVSSLKRKSNVERIAAQQENRSAPKPDLASPKAQAWNRLEPMWIVRHLLASIGRLSEQWGRGARSLASGFALFSGSFLSSQKMRQAGHFFAQALHDLVVGTVDEGLYLAGLTLSTVQSWFGFEHAGRTLNQTEREALRSVFGKGFNDDLIRIKEGSAGWMHIDERAFTLGNTIYIKNNDSLDILMHEAAHIWQFQHRGPAYLRRSLTAQIKGGAYEFEAQVRSGLPFEELEPEAQAEYIRAVLYPNIKALNQGAAVPSNRLVGGRAYALRALTILRQPSGW